MELNDYINANLVHSVHTSERRSRRGCPLKTHWIYDKGYYPLVTAKPLEFGIAMHKALEKYYDPLTWFDLETKRALALGAFSESIDQQYKNYCRLNSPSPEMKAEYDERRELGLSMLRYYIDVESPIHDQGFTPVKVEIGFEVPIFGPDGEVIWCKCDRCWKRFWLSEAGALFISEAVERLRDEGASCFCVDPENEHPWESWREHWQGLPVTYGGRIDCLAKDRLGRLWIVDWKTAAKLSTGEPGADDDYMWLDDQIASYCWALFSIGIDVAGFVYAEIKKAVPEEPEPNKYLRLGRRYSVSKQINTTYDLYMKTVKENDPQAYELGLYDDFLEFLKGPKGPKFVLRHQITLAREEFDVIGQDIYNEALDIIDPNKRIYATPGRFTCGYCAFNDPCKSRRRGQDYQYTLDTLYEQRERHYYEVPNTDDRHN